MYQGHDLYFFQVRNDYDDVRWYAFALVTLIVERTFYVGYILIFSTLSLLPLELIFRLK